MNTVVVTSPICRFVVETLYMALVAAAPCQSQSSPALKHTLLYALLEIRDGDNKLMFHNVYWRN